MIKTIMIYKRRHFSFLVLLLGILINGCNPSREWDEHYNSPILSINKDVLSLIKETGNYSIFYEKLVETGYDSLLMKDQFFTVFVPNNEAFSGLPDYSAEEWRKIIGFHICYASFFSKDFADTRVQTIIGKYLNVKKLGPENVTVFNATINPDRIDLNFRNGIIHEVDKVLIPRLNIYEFIASLGDDYSLTKKYLSSMDQVYLDLEKSTRIGVNDQGNTIYDTVWARKNYFLDNVAGLNNETTNYTALLIRDADVRSAIDKASQYFGNVAELDEKSYLQILSIVYSAAYFNGLYTVNQMPATLVSVTGKSLAISDIHFSTDVDIEMSNGLVHVLDGFNIPKEFFLYPIVIEADNKTGRRVSNTVYSNEIKSDSRATNGTFFQYGSKFIGDYIEYSVDMVLATKYWIIWTSPALGGSIYQLSVDSVNIGKPVDNYYKGNFKPVVSGSVTFSRFGTKTIRMTVSGQSIPGYNSIYLDYIKLIPDELYTP
jgi:uncharacterized surface protein with fasciclin (FAS1) repeats